MKYTIRASSLWSLLDCPYRWAAEHLDGLRRPAAAPTWIGTAVHRSTAAFDASRLTGNAITADDAAGVLVDAIQHPDEEVDWGDTSPREAEKRALLVHTRYCADVAPQRAYIAVEHTLTEMPIDMGDDLIIVLTGTLDRIREDDGKRGIGDLKTGARAVDGAGGAATAKHGPQAGTYELLAERDFGPMELPAEIIGLQTSTKAAVGTGLIHNARRALVGDDENPGFLEFVAQYFRSGLFPPNPGSTLCSAKYCAKHPTCIYHP